MKKENLYLFLLFINLYMPLSPYFCMAVNIIALAFQSNNLRLYNCIGKKLNSITILSFFIFVLSLIAFIGYSNPEFEVLGKYLRSFITTFLLISLGGSIVLTEEKLLRYTLYILLIHIATIPIQMAFPSIVPPMAEFFNCDRDPALFQKLSIRNMGVAGSFDMASYFSIIGFVLSFALFKKSKHNLYLLIAFVFFVSLIRISRTGMLVGTIFFVICLIGNYKHTSRKSRLFFIAIFAGLIVALSVRILPLISSTSNLLDNTRLYHYEDIEQLNDYGANSSEGLMTYHLDVLHHIEPYYLMMGGAFSPNSTAYGSDIGYVKMICNVGVIGLFLILVLHYLIFKKIKKYAKSNYSQFSYFLIMSIVVVMVLNYKNLLMYSRGAYDGLIFMTAVAINSSIFFKKKNVII